MTTMNDLPDGEHNAPAENRPAPPHVLRMIAEYDELEERIKKLRQFIGATETRPVADIFQTLSRTEQVLLSEQFGHMTSYASVLRQRIDMERDKPFIHPTTIGPL